MEVNLTPLGHMPKWGFVFICSSRLPGFSTSRFVMLCADGFSSHP